jgi:hypothetical protein
LFIAAAIAPHEPSPFTYKIVISGGFVKGRLSDYLCPVSRFDSIATGGDVTIEEKIEIKNTQYAGRLEMIAVNKHLSLRYGLFS